MATTPLTQEQVTSALRELPNWKHERDALTHNFEFGSFKEAMSFMVRVSYEAESLDHHPEWTNIYNKVFVRLTTHDAGNKVSEKDVMLAKRIAVLSWVK